jgi:hypothetical protein
MKPPASRPTRVLALLLAVALLAGCGTLMQVANGIGPRGDPDAHLFAPWKEADRLGRQYCPEREFPAEGSLRYRSAAEREPGGGLDRALAGVGPSMAATFADETSRPFYWYFASPRSREDGWNCPCQVWMDGKTLRVWAVRTPR